MRLNVDDVWVAPLRPEPPVLCEPARLFTAAVEPPFTAPLAGADATADFVEDSLAFEWSDVDDEVLVAVEPETLALVVDVVAETLAGGTLSAGRLDPMLVATAGTVSDLTSGTGGVGGDATRSSVEVVTAAALLVADATVVVAVETAAFVVVAAVETAFIVVVATVETAFVVVAAAVETAFVVVAAVDLAIATVDATECATGSGANPAAHDSVGQNAAAIRTPAAIGPANVLVLTCLTAPPRRVLFGLVVGLPRISARIHGRVGCAERPPIRLRWRWEPPTR